jgi:hypothetical protein
VFLHNNILKQKDHKLDSIKNIAHNSYLSSTRGLGITLGAKQYINTPSTKTTLLNSFSIYLKDFLKKC